MKQAILEVPSCSIQFEHRMSYLYVVATGKWENSESCKKIWNQIIAENKTNQYQKILLERKIEGIGKVSEIRDLITELSDFIEGKYIAFTDSKPEHFQTNRLTEMSATNMGLNVKFCSSVGEAKEWLLLK